MVRLIPALMLGLFLAAGVDAQTHFGYSGDSLGSRGATDVRVRSWSGDSSMRSTTRTYGRMPPMNYQDYQEVPPGLPNPGVVYRRGRMYVPVWEGDSFETGDSSISMGTTRFVPVRPYRPYVPPPLPR